MPGGPAPGTAFFGLVILDLGAAAPPALIPEALPGDLPGDVLVGDPFFFAPPQLRRWMTNLSGKKVLAQLGHGSRAFSLYSLKASALYSSLFSSVIFPQTMSSKFLGG